MGVEWDDDAKMAGSDDDPKASGRYVVRPKPESVKITSRRLAPGSRVSRVSPTLPPAGLARSTPANSVKPSQATSASLASAHRSIGAGKTPVQHRLPEPGEIVGDTYRVVRALGEGGMGSVFEATHKRLNHSVALKTIHPSMAGSTEIRRAFFREARFAASMRHPQLIAVLDYGEDDAFGPYLIMELLEGELVSSIVDHGAEGFAEDEILEIGVQLCDALAFVHGQGLAHGDIKAPNLMLVHDEIVDVRRLKLIDFGLARTRTQKHDGKVTGTPEYLAPELIQGQQLSAKSDLYAVGALLFELICLRPPFCGEIAEVLRSQVYDAPPRPSEVGGQVSVALENLVLRLLSKNPDARPESANALRLELSGLRSRGAERHSVDEERDRICRGAFDTTSVARAVLSADGEIEVANRAMRTVMSPTGGPVIGTAIVETVWAREWPELTDDLRAAASGEIISRRVGLPFGVGRLEFFTMLERSEGGSVQLLAIPVTSLG